MTDEIDNNYKLLKLKSDVYDIIRQQEQLNIQNNILQEHKIKISQEIQTLEKEINEINQKTS
jgi:vacuolar-type H+-ATPase subunit I/STV1